MKGALVVGVIAVSGTSALGARAEAPFEDTPADRARVLRRGEHIVKERDRRGPVLGGGHGLAIAGGTHGFSMSLSLRVGFGFAPRWVTAFEFDLLGMGSPQPAEGTDSFATRERYWATVRYYPDDKFWLSGGGGAAAVRNDNDHDVWSPSGGGGFGGDIWQWPNGALGLGLIASTWRWNDRSQIDMALQFVGSIGG